MSLYPDLSQKEEPLLLSLILLRCFSLSGVYLSSSNLIINNGIAINSKEGQPTIASSCINSMTIMLFISLTLYSTLQIITTTGEGERKRS